MEENYHKWYSPNLSKEMEMIVYGHWGYPLLIFPTTRGRYYESKDFHLIDSIAWFIEQGKVKVYCLDSIDEYSWYNRSIHPADRVKNHIWYDKMILEEVVAKVQHESPNGKVAVSGCSFGGYHAANFAFRHPEKVSHLFTMSGAFDIRDQLDGYYDDNVYFNNPVDYLPNMNHPDLYNMKIILGTSEHDICLGANLEMSAILSNKGIDHWLDNRPNASHDWPIWREMFPHYLSLM